MPVAPIKPRKRALRWLLSFLTAVGTQSVGGVAFTRAAPPGRAAASAVLPSPPGLLREAGPVGPRRDGDNLPAPRPEGRPQPPEAIESPEILSATFEPIDLGAALRLAGVQNPQIQLAQQRVAEALGARLVTLAALLPTINTGTNLDAHNGPLQQSNGNILKVNRDALFGGLGANAIAAGSVNIPGIVLAGNFSEAIFGALTSRQVVRARQAEAVAVRNRILLDVTSAYIDLLRAEGERAIALKTREETKLVAVTTANFARTGQGKVSDANRAASELEQRNIDLLQADNAILAASARLTELLGLDPSVRLHAIDGWVVPMPLVPDDRSLAFLIGVALANRPELAAQRSAIQAALYRLRQARLLPFAPNLIAGYSAGQFGGGSNILSAGVLQANGTLQQQHRFGNFGGRQDIDIILYWSLRGLGLGNIGLNRVARANLNAANYRLAEIINQVRTEVATAYARVHARYAQIPVGERAVRSSLEGYQEDLRLTRQALRRSLPIEVLDSLRLLLRGRNAYLAAVLEYNRAQFELFVALGQPPPAVFAQPIPEKVFPRPALSPPPVPGDVIPHAPCPPGQPLPPQPGQWAAQRR